MNSAPARSKMSVISEFFDRLNQRGIRYCHMKGTERHLKRSFDGTSDIDILVDIHQRTSFQSFMEESGLKRFLKVRDDGEADDVEDYFLLDTELERLIHWHVHYKLPLGHSFRKNIRTEWESIILDARVFNEQYNSFCIAAVHDLTLLFCSEALSMRILFGFSVDQPDPKRIDDYSELKSKVQQAQLEDELHRLFKSPDSILNTIKSGFTKRSLSRLAPILFKAFGKTGSHTLYSFTSLFNEFAIKVQRKWTSFAHPLTPLKRINPRGGRLIVVFGNAQFLPRDFEKSLGQLFGRKIDFHFANLSKKSNWHRLQVAKNNRMIAVGCLPATETLDQSFKASLENNSVDLGIAVIENTPMPDLDILTDLIVAIPSGSGRALPHGLLEHLWKVL